MKKTLLQLLVIIIGLNFAPNVVLPKSLDDLFLYSTAFIKNKSTGGAGTGFLVLRKISKNRSAIYLVSNKHVVSPRAIDPKQKNHIAKAEIDINTSVRRKIQKTTFTIVLRDSNGNLFVKDHPNPQVDVAAIYISREINKLTGTVFAIPEKRFATKEFISKNFVSPGDRSLLIGYPLSLVERGHVTPVVRNAIIATKPNQEFRGLPAFLIDGTVLRGSSGSPVILPIRPYGWKGKYNVSIGSIQENHLLGIAKGHIKNWEMIIRKTVTPESMQEFTIVDNSQLGLVFAADTILEVMDLFEYKKWEE